MFYRKKVGKEDNLRISERFAKPGLPRPEGNLLWFHACSLGESLSVLPLLNKTIELYPDLNILFTTGTTSSAKIMAHRLPNKVIHQFVPIDKTNYIKKFLKHWQPSLAIFVESELWPNLIIETHRSGCKMVQINARISRKSFNRMIRLHSLAKEILSCFSISIVQSEIDEERFRILGAKNVVYLGNLKFDAPPLASDPKETGKILNMIEERKLWLAASTHEGEDEIIARTHQKLKTSHENLLTIICPRHPHRGKDIANKCKELGLKTAIRSSGEEIEDKTDIYIANTIGELGIFYRITHIVMMGGSIIEHGGQNPLEPARLECALITGMHTDNFSQIYTDLSEQGAVMIIKDEKDLYEKVDKLLNDPELQEEMAKSSYQYAKSKSGVINKVMEKINPLLADL